jgi:hypothetical protein
MNEVFARLSVVYMIAFMILFDKMHWRRKHWQETHLLSQDDSQRLLRILAATAER